MGKKRHQDLSKSRINQSIIEYDHFTNIQKDHFL